MFYGFKRLMSFGFGTIKQYVVENRDGLGELESSYNSLKGIV
jgi:hypothetical protein